MDKGKLIAMLMGLVLDMLTPDRLKDFADLILDFIENKVEQTENKIDDMTIGVLCKTIRTAFDIPDND